MFLQQNFFYQKIQSKIKNYFIYYYFLLSCFTTFLALKHGLTGKEKKCFSLFTRQNTIILNLFLLATLIAKFQNSKYSLYGSFILLINNLLIFIFCLLRREHYLNYTFEHKIMPVLFFYYYFFINEITIKWSHFYIGFIYPFLYFVIFMFIGYFDHNYLPYKEMDFKNQDNVVANFSANSCLILLFILLFVLFVILIKNKQKNLQKE